MASVAGISIGNASSSDKEWVGGQPNYSTSRVDSHGVQRIVDPEPDHGVVDEGGKDPHQDGCPGCGLVTESTGCDHSWEEKCLKLSRFGDLYVSQHRGFR